MTELERPLPPEITLPISTENLRGQAAIVTGGNKGIGRYITAKLAQHGVNVEFGSRKSNESEALAKSLEESINGREGWGEVHWNPGDITEEDVRKRLVNNTIERYGKLDILVNNAGQEKMGFLVDYDEKPAKELFEVNFWAQFGMNKLAIRQMSKQRKGHIIGISTIGAKNGLEGDSVYVASKLAVEGMSLSAAPELIRRNVKINVIRPGLVEDTGITNLDGNEENKAKLRDRFTERSIVKKPVDGEHIAEGVIFIVSDRIPGYTGQILEIANGYR